MSLHDEVTAAHARGWALTPLNGKAPFLDDWQSEPMPALGRVQGWARAGNVGLRTGKISGVVVIDDDSDDHQAGVRLGLPRTVTVRTGSGKLHYYFKCPEGGLRNSVKTLADDVDVRGDGGQVVFVGSTHPETKKPYTWEPGLSPDDVPLAEWPAELLAKSLPTKPPVPVPTNGTNGTNWAKKAVENELARMRAAAEGTRNDTLNKAAFNLGQIVGGGGLAEEQVQAALLAAALATGLPEGEARATLRSGMQSGTQHPRTPAPTPEKRRGARQGSSKKGREQKAPSVAAAVDDGDETFDLLDDLRGYAESVPAASEGARIDAAVKLARTLRSLGDDGAAPSEELITRVVAEWAARCTPPLSDVEVAQCVAAAAGQGMPSPAKQNERRRATEDDASDWIPLTDTGNAERLATRCAGSVRYCPAWRTTVAWQGTHWANDHNIRAMQIAKEVARSLYARAAKIEDETLRDATTSWARQSEKAERRRAMVDLLKCEPGIPISHEVFDRNPFLLNCPNGTLDLRTFQLRAHSKDDFLTKLCRTRYVPSAQCPRWTQFLERVLPDDDVRAYFQRFAGYCLTGDVSEQMFLIAYGDGSNGKTTALRVLQAVLTRAYAIQIAADLLAAKTQRGHPTEVADLFGVRLAVGTETDKNQQLDEALVKQLTGGDLIRARRMREDFWEFEPTHKIVIVTNHLPVIRGREHAIWRRLHAINFEVRIPPAECDKKLLSKLLAEREGILAWMVEGCRQWQKIGLAPPEGVQLKPRAVEPTIAEQFIAVGVRRTPGSRVAASELHAAFQAWCAQQEIGSCGQREFGIAMGAAGYGRKKSNGTYVYLDAAIVGASDLAVGTMGSMGTDSCIGRLTSSHERVNAEDGPQSPQGPQSALGDHADGGTAQPQNGAPAGGSAS